MRGILYVCQITKLHENTEDYAHAKSSLTEVSVATQFPKFLMALIDSCNFLSAITTEYLRERDVSKRL